MAPDDDAAAPDYEPAELPRRDTDVDPHFTNPADYRLDPDVRPDEWQPYRGRRAVAVVVTSVSGLLIAGLWAVNIDDMVYGGGSPSLFQYVGTLILTGVLIVPVVPVWLWARTQRRRTGYRGD